MLLLFVTDVALLFYGISCYIFISVMFVLLI